MKITDRDFALVPEFENYMIDTNQCLWKKVEVKAPIKDYEAQYELVSLFNNGKSRSTSIHQLMAEAFLENPDNLPEVNHKNEIKYDNRLDNLEYCDRTYNINYGNANNKRSAGHKKPLYQIDLDGNLVRYWESVKDVIEENKDWKRQYIDLCVQGKIATAYGFIWKHPYKPKERFKTASIVKQFDKDKKFMRLFESYEEAGEVMGVGGKSIYMNAKGHSKSCCDCLWEFWGRHNYFKESLPWRKK